MTLNARSKGQVGEREAADLLAGWAREAGIIIHPSRNLVQSREGGHDLVGVPGMAVEVKRVEGTGVKHWWAQCERQAKAVGQHPFLMHRRNRQPWRFRTVATVFFSGPTVRRVPMVVDLELAPAKIWFQYFLFHYKEASPDD